MNSYALSIQNDLGIEEGGIPKEKPIFDDFKPLAELVFNTEELKKYELNSLKKIQNGSKTTTAELNEIGETDEMDVDEESKDKLLKYVLIEEFPNKSLREQILSITITNMENSISESKKSIEQLLSFICQELGILSFKWSTIDDVEASPIFIKFMKVSDLVKFISLYEKLEPEKLGTIAMDDNVAKLYDDKKEDLDLDPVKIMEFFSQQGYHHSTKEKNDIYSDYKVDPKELAEVPKDLIDTVKNDIVEFRLRVLKLEKLKREKDAINDKKKSRFKLKKLYQDISKTKNIDDEDEDTEEDFINDENDILDDLENEQMMQNKLQDLVENEYLVKLQMIREQDASRLKLFNTYHTLKNYSTTIGQKREKFYKDFVNIESTNNKVDKNLEKFYLNHANYLKFRSDIERREELKDSNDKEIITMINELIEEFIGVEDESLSSFIMNLVDENYPRQIKVIELLKETLDEDAEVFVNKLWDQINV